MVSKCTERPSLQTQQFAFPQTLKSLDQSLGQGELTNNIVKSGQETEDQVSHRLTLEPIDTGSFYAAHEHKIRRGMKDAYLYSSGVQCNTRIMRKSKSLVLNRFRQKCLKCAIVNLSTKSPSNKQEEILVKGLKLIPHLKMTRKRAFQKLRRKIFLQYHLPNIATNT